MMCMGKVCKKSNTEQMMYRGSVCIYGKYSITESLEMTSYELYDVVGYSQVLMCL